MVALAMGGFTIGTTEFASMGLLPNIADGVHVSISHAGSLITAYALGVVVGAPALAALGAGMERRTLALWLIAAMGVGNLLSAAASGFGLLWAARFVTGLPHGAYFGVASIIAAGMVPPHHKGRAVAWVIGGLSVANLVGVPATTALGQAVGWRAAYVAIGVLALTAGWLVVTFVPRVPVDPTHDGGRGTARAELGALKDPHVWYIFGAGAIGFAGMFAFYSYIAPAVTQVGHLRSSAVPVFLFMLGLGMVVGTWAGGRLVEWSIHRTVLGSLACVAAFLGLFVLAVPHGWWALPVALLISTAVSVLALALQLQLMHATTRAPTMGASLTHSSLNVANALGAALGAVVIGHGWGFRAPALAGMLVSLVGIVLLALTAYDDRRRRAATG